MSGHPFLIPTWINPSIQPPARPLYPLPLAQAYPSLSQLINLQLQHARSIAEEGKAHSSILRPRAVRLSDMNLLGTPGMSNWPRNVALGHGFPHVRFDAERGELGWKPPMFEVSAPAQNCFNIRDSHCPDALLTRYTDVGISPHLPDFGDVSRLAHKPDVHLLFQDFLYRHMELAHLRRMSELNRCTQKEERIAHERGVNSMDTFWRVLPLSTISAEHTLEDTEDSIRKTAMEKHVLDQSSGRKDQRDGKAQDNDRRGKLYLQKFTQRALKNAQKHFMTPLPRQKDCRSGVLKSTAKLASDLKIVTCNESQSDEKVLERASSARDSVVTDFNNAKKNEMNDTIYMGFRGIDLETDPREKTGDNSNDMDLNNSVNTNFSSRHNLQGDRKIFKCPQCRYLTDRKNNLKRHVVTMHQESAKTLECCGIGFQSKAALRDHNAIFHRGGYRCQICSRNFCRKALLRRHLTVHSGQKDFFCDLCGYATSHKSNLERHQKVHNKRDVAAHVSKQRAVSLKASGDLGITLPSSYADFLLHPEDFELVGHPDRSVFTYDNVQRSLTPTQNVRVRKEKRLSALMAGVRGKSEYVSDGCFNDLKTDMGFNDDENRIPVAVKEIQSSVLDINDQKMNSSPSRGSHIQTIEDLQSMDFECVNSAKVSKTDEYNNEDLQNNNSNDASDNKIEQDGNDIIR